MVNIRGRNFKKMKFKIALLCLCLFFMFYRSSEQKLRDIHKSVPAISIEESTLDDFKNLKEKGFRIEGDNYVIIYEEPNLEGGAYLEKWQEQSGYEKMITEKEYVIGKIDFCSNDHLLVILQMIENEKGTTERVIINSYGRSFTFHYQVVISGKEELVTSEEVTRVETESTVRKGVLITKEKELILNPTNEMGSIRITEKKSSLCGFSNNRMERELLFIENDKSENLYKIWESN